ncbi:SRPBCC family protein [Mangrovicoccus ximenensis]|uniref:SRPBCC family protein n=1 Tax=Mangrovicoccus ximenensis TaxID=1911570 RepID=UPI000D390AE1|nr:SRPBCC family protein [Mangrovicoccus ximenensis]
MGRATVTARFFDEDDKPVSGLKVMLQIFLGSRSAWMTLATGATDGAGQLRLVFDNALINPDQAIPAMRLVESGAPAPRMLGAPYGMRTLLSGRVRVLEADFGEIEVLGEEAYPRRAAAPTVVRRHVTLAHPPAAVWAHFADLPSVARCLPGAELAETDGSSFTGHVAVRFGPITARFEGEGRFDTDPDARSGSVRGAGKDRGGQSNVTGGLDFAIAEGTSSARSEVDVALRFRIEGRLGQFNRPELVSGLVDHLLGEFVANCNATLDGGPIRDSRGIGLWSILRAIGSGLFRRG